jgi:hypothetical protein
MTATGYDSIVALGQELSRPLGTLLALSDVNDPFFADRAGRLQAAEWFAELWNRFGFGSGTHVRRIHYILVSRAEPIICPDGTAYQNTTDCWKKLINASRDARYLRLVAVEDFDDRRNDAVIEHLIACEQDASLTVEAPIELADCLSWQVSPLREPPDFSFEPAIVGQRYHVELWCEKSTMNDDVLVPLARQYGLNVVTAAGEISVTHCHQLIERAKTIGRPVRIFYSSDFDPAGMSMPVACARKIEFFIRRDDLDLDIQVRPIALTDEQCRQYRLPRTPIKQTERRAERFEERFGEGATELDALEALHPGELRRLLEQEIARYYDDDLDDRVDQAADYVRGELREIRDDILERHAEELAELQERHKTIVDAINADLAEIAERYQAAFAEIINRHNRLQDGIAGELEAEAPDLNDLVDWPEPDDGNEDDDPLFDSTRDYLEQIDRFKFHQGKPTERKSRKRNGGEP